MTRRAIASRSGWRLTPRSLRAALEAAGPLDPARPQHAVDPVALGLVVLGKQLGRGARELALAPAALAAAELGFAGALHDGLRGCGVDSMDGSSAARAPADTDPGWRRPHLGCPFPTRRGRRGR